VTVVEEQPFRARRQGGDVAPAPIQRRREGREEVPALRLPSEPPAEGPLSRERSTAVATEPIVPVRKQEVVESAVAPARSSEVLPERSELRRRAPDPWTSLTLPARRTSVEPSRDEARLSWPSLPELRGDGPLEQCRTLLQEARLRDDLDREQRGLPWNA